MAVPNRCGERWLLLSQVVSRLCKVVNVCIGTRQRKERSPALAPGPLVHRYVHSTRMTLSLNTFYIHTATAGSWLRPQMVCTCTWKCPAIRLCPASQTDSIPRCNLLAVKGGVPQSGCAQPHRQAIRRCVCVICNEHESFTSAPPSAPES